MHRTQRAPLSPASAAVRRAQEAVKQAVCNILLACCKQIVVNAQVSKEADILERTRNSLLGNNMRGQSVDLFPIKDDLALGGIVHAGNHIEQCCLSGSVGTETP